MKTSITTLFIIGVVAGIGTLAYLNHAKTPPTPAPVTASVHEAERVEQAPAETPVVPQPEPPRPVAIKASETAPVPVTNSVSGDSKPEAISAALSQAIDTLASQQIGFSTRRELMQRLKEAGELDQVIAELKRRAADHPDDPGIPIALGVGLMNKFPVHDMNEAATLGLEIDNSFDAALKLDPANWEAQFEKAHAMAYWPEVAGKGPEVIQRFSSLIDQQEMMTPQLQFAQTYVQLGNQYQRSGQSDYAMATWNLGLAKFPNDPGLKKKVGGK